MADYSLLFIVRARVNKAYELQLDSGKQLVYCHMTDNDLGACGGGGWTLVMKTDGNKVVHLSLSLSFSFLLLTWSAKRERENVKTSGSGDENAR